MADRYFPWCTRFTTMRVRAGVDVQIMQRAPSGRPMTQVRCAAFDTSRAQRPSSLKNSTAQRGCTWKMLGVGNVERILQNTGELCAVKPQAAQNGCYAAPGGRRGTKKIQCGPGCRPRPRCRIRSACTDRAHAIQRSEGVRGDGAALSACAASFRERA